MNTTNLLAEADYIDRIGPRIGQYRDLLSQGWSQPTAYPGSVKPSQWTTGNPHGQCGVSSVWLAHRLLEEFGISATFCRGSLQFTSQCAEDVPDHCWLEVVANSGQTLVLDLTCDQASGFEQAHIFEPVSELEDKGIHYIGRDRLPVADLPDSILTRYKLLRSNLGEIEEGCTDARGAM